MRALIVEAVRNSKFNWVVPTITELVNLVDFLAMVESENGEFKSIGTFKRKMYGEDSDIIVFYVKVPTNGDVIRYFEVTSDNTESNESE